MPITIPTPLQAAQHGDSDNILLRKILNLWGAIAQGQIGLTVDGVTVDGSSFSTDPSQVSSAPSNFAPITVAADVVLASGDQLFIQNLGTNPLFVKRGTGASSSSFNYVLAAAVAADDGTGGSLVIDDFIGSVSFAGTSVRYNAWKR
jgi:hypothetical protein